MIVLLLLASVLAAIALANVAAVVIGRALADLEREEPFL